MLPAPGWQNDSVEKSGREVPGAGAAFGRPPVTKMSPGLWLWAGPKDGSEDQARVCSSSFLSSEGSHFYGR